MLKSKKYKWLLCFLVAIVIFITGSSKANALTIDASLTRTKVPNVYYERTRTNYYFSYQFSAYDMNRKVAYCIEPAVDILHLDYTGSDDLTGVSGYSADTMRKVLLYAYYGYGYGNHTTMKHRIATQTLIWETVNTYKFTYHTERYGYGDYIDISNEINSIQRDVDAHYIRPSFNGQTITAQVGERVTLTDTNGVLSNFQVLGDNIADIIIDGNTLSFRVTSIGNVNLRFVKKQYTNEVALVYANGNSQKMVTKGAVDPVYFSVNVNSLGGIVDLQKLDSKTLLATPRGDGLLKDATYEIFNMEDVKVGEITTNNGGFGESLNLPAFGRYYLKESTSSLGYTLDQTKYYFESTLEDINPSVRVFEKAIEREVELYKVFANGSTTILTYEPNVTFEFYLKSNNELYETATTDANGRLSVVLPYGTYIGKQVTTTPNYEKVKDFEIVINDDSLDPITKIISNAEITAKLKLVKIDSDSNKVIVRDGIKFQIKDLSTNEYVCQNITYPTKTKLCVFETSKGAFITPYVLKSGNYQIEELENQTIDGYLWNSTPLKFSITDNIEFVYDEEFGVMVEVKFENKQVKGEFEINKLGEKLVIENDTFRYEEIKLDGVSYNLYANGDIISQDGTMIYKDKDLVKSFVTDNGYYKLSDLYLGSYCLVENASVLGHLVDEESHCFTLSYKDQYTSVVSLSFEFKNYLPKGTLIFSKTDLVTGDPIPNTLIEIYSDTDETSTLIFSGYTDENGLITIENLFIGKGHIIEKESATGYELTDEIIYFEILENGEIVKATMTNEQIVVPNTSISDSKVIDIIGFVFIALGIGYIVYDKKRKK